VEVKGTEPGPGTPVGSRFDSLYSLCGFDRRLDAVLGETEVTQLCGFDRRSDGFAGLILFDLITARMTGLHR
jgi:hypothetical protein